MFCSESTLYNLSNLNCLSLSFQRAICFQPATRSKSLFTIPLEIWIVNSKFEFLYFVLFSKSLSVPSLACRSVSARLFNHISHLFASLFFKKISLFLCLLYLSCFFGLFFSDFIHTELYTSHKELLILRFNLYFFVDFYLFLYLWIPLLKKQMIYTFSMFFSLI